MYAFKIHFLAYCSLWQPGVFNDSPLFNPVFIQIWLTHFAPCVVRKSAVLVWGANRRNSNNMNVKESLTCSVCYFESAGKCTILLWNCLSMYCIVTPKCIVLLFCGNNFIDVYCHMLTAAIEFMLRRSREIVLRILYALAWREIREACGTWLTFWSQNYFNFSTPCI